ncbi:hypothetical protein AM587_10007164 [Phytophthora nicotianae]|uniref:Chitin-binding type-4 domain-containing protein n=5 Tax=Phytophthora nicotianae TaxID=4792 RepID=V9FZ42_PHYNI|nr:hypothetical protein F443_01348 [Phytophthora nicotianae P1569]ETO84781.1 hypothetical protein F444_01350 [Phytophthora nicotianae P1976]KUF88217.1 hypothetical protein AM587_10007164 [Phytophthora nicotianae]
MIAPSSILALASLVASVHAHGYISKPKATYQPNTPYTNYNAITTAGVNKGFAGGKYDGSPSQNTQVFTEHWNATGYKSLRDMTDPIATDYGYSVETATPVDVTGYTEMWWQNDEYKEGFIASHEGPCEAWIGETQVFHYDNCAARFKSYPAKIPVDYSSCKGDCLLVFYWLALHEPNWQIYKQCVPITNNGSGASTTTQSSASDETPSNAPVVTPAATTTAPVATKAPVAQTPAPAQEVLTAAPVATKGPVVQTPTPAPEVTTATPETPSTPTTPAPEVTSATPDVPDQATPSTTAPEVTTATPDVPDQATPSTTAPAPKDNCLM